MSLYFNNKRKSQFTTRKPVPNIPTPKKNIKPKKDLKPEIKSKKDLKPEIKVEETPKDKKIKETPKEIKKEKEPTKDREMKEEDIVSFNDANIKYIKFTSKMKQMGIENCNDLLKEDTEELFNKLPKDYIKKKTFNKYIKKAKKALNK